MRPQPLLAASLPSPLRVFPTVGPHVLLSRGSAQQPGLLRPLVGRFTLGEPSLLFFLSKKQEKTGVGQPLQYLSLRCHVPSLADTRGPSGKAPSPLEMQVGCGDSTGEN